MGVLCSDRRFSLLVAAAVLHGLLAFPVQAAPGKRPVTMTGEPLPASGLVLEKAMPAAAATGCKTQRQRVNGVTFRGCHFPGKQADAPGTARAFLDAHGKALGLAAGSRDLELIEVKQGLASAHTRFRQKVAGYPVFQAYVSVHQGRDGTVRSVHSAYISKQTSAHSGATRLNAAQAEKIAQTGINKSAAVKAPLRMPTQSELLWFQADSGELLLAWKLMVFSTEPLGDFLIIIDASSGELLLMENRMAFIDGSGYVYEPNPVQYHGNWTLISDSGDANSTLLEDARIDVILQGLDTGTGLLKGEFVDMTLPKQGKPVPDADESTRVYNYTRDNQRFEQVVVYYTVDSIQRYFHALGFDDDVGIANGIRDFPTLANAHWYKQDQSFYSTGDDAIHFGDGGVDDGEDADIVAHEYGHAVQHDQNSAWGGGEMGAMGEGFGDYLAASFFATNGNNTYQDSDAACVGEWDATSYDNGNPPCLRRVDGDKHYPEDLVGSVHADGEIWSAALWDIRSTLGAFTTDQLVLEHHFALPGSASMGTAALEMIDAESNLYGGTNEAVIRQKFCGRGILSGSDCDTDNDGLNDAAEILLGTDPNNPDSDGDTLTDGEEVALGTNPLLADTDGDGFNDDAEIAAGSDPLDDTSIPGNSPDGDVNDDGQVDAADLLLAMRILTGHYIPSVAEQSRWDVAPLVNGVPVPDGQNDVGDYVVLLRKVTGAISF
ncbi:MAG: M36 family metallopeptidase [Pseudomonadota bacterium]